MSTATDLVAAAVARAKERIRHEAVDCVEFGAIAALDAGWSRATYLAACEAAWAVAKEEAKQ